MVDQCYGPALNYSLILFRSLWHQPPWRHKASFRLPARSHSWWAAGLTGRDCRGGSYVTDVRTLLVLCATHAWVCPVQVPKQLMDRSKLGAETSSALWSSSSQLMGRWSTELPSRALTGTDPLRGPACALVACSRCDRRTAQTQVPTSCFPVQKWDGKRCSVPSSDGW